MEIQNTQLLCSRLKELRSSLNLTQKEFAEKIGASTVSISSYEIGAKTPSLDMLLIIAKTFDVSIDWLCGLSDNPNQTGEIKTYSELIRLLISILDNTCIDSDIVFLNGPSDYDFPPTTEPYVFPYIYINDEKIRTFFHEWKDLSRLLHAGTIKQELFRLWLNDKLQSLSIPLSKQNSIAEKRLPFV